MFEKWKTSSRWGSCLRLFWVLASGRRSSPPMRSPPVNAARWPRCRNCPQAAISPAKFMSGYEDYATDQFPLREQFRTLKALMGLYVFGQKDNNGVYLADGSAAKLEYPLNEGSVAHAADRFRYLYETLMAGTDARSTSP